MKRKYINHENNIYMDEKAFTYNMHNNVTLHKKGAQTVIIKTQKQGKLRISAFMSICGNGHRLRPYIIFKGVNNGLIFKSFQN